MPKERCGELALGSASGKAIKYLKRPRMEQIGSAGAVDRPLTPTRRDTVERVECGHGAQGCALCGTRWNLIGKPIAGAKTIRDM